MKRPVQYIKANAVTATWDCVSCKSVQSTVLDDSIDVEGGCQGHTDGAYCYCGPKRFVASIECGACGIKTELELTS